MWALFVTTQPGLNSKSLKPLFYERDEMFKLYIHQRIGQRVGMPQHHLEGSKFVSQIDDSEIHQVWMIFAHLVITYSKLNADYSTPQHVVCEDGFKFVMRQPMDDVVMFAVAGTESVRGIFSPLFTTSRNEVSISTRFIICYSI